MKTKKSKRGRPPLTQKALMQPITVRFPKPMMREVESLMAKRADAPDKGQVIRELVATGLKHTRK